MNWKYALGAALNRSAEAVLCSRFFPLTRYFPYGHFWLYDVQRIRGSRSLGAVCDAGANVGQTVKDFLRYAPDADIYSFEPGPDAFSQLDRRFGQRKNVHVFNAALGANRSTMALQLREDSELNTLVAADTAATSADATRIVDVTTLDDVAASHGLSHFDVLKMDVQGWEMEVLKGAAGLMAQQNLVFIFSEVAFRADQTEMQQFGELHTYLERQGFVLCGFYDLLRYGPAKEFVFFANALYMNPHASLKWGGDRVAWESWLATQK